jgi:hypothetical protein
LRIKLAIMERSNLNKRGSMVPPLPIILEFHLSNQVFGAQGLAAQGLAAQGFAAHGLAAQGLAAQGLVAAFFAALAARVLTERVLAERLCELDDQPLGPQGASASAGAPVEATAIPPATISIFARD